MAKRSKAAATRKPYKAFPLTAHPNGSWVKRCKPPGAAKTKTFYFGPLADPKAALAKFNREWPFLIEGKLPPPETDDADGDVCVMRVLCNEFLLSKRNKMAAGELVPRTYQDYYLTCERLIEFFGKDRRVDDLRPSEFEGFRAKLAAKFGPTTLGNEINRAKIILKFASDQKLIDRPVDFGQSFDRPSPKVLRRIRNEAGPKVFTRDELRTILGALEGKSKLRAMVLLGLNAGLGNTDCANLRDRHLDLSAGWMNYPRPKTEVPRRVPLWPETVAAIKLVLKSRPRPLDPADAGLVFLTRTRRAYVRLQPTANGTEAHDVVGVDEISKSFSKVLHKLNINGRAGLGFYTLRRQFEIIGGEAKDQVAVDSIMGHVDSSMAAVYRQNVISDDRLRAVTEHVRDWLFAADGGAT